jgi:hypothetical protein
LQTPLLGGGREIVFDTLCIGSSLEALISLAAMA